MEKATLTDREKYPEVYRAVEPHHVDWRTRKRTVPMRVLALGMPRTATACTSPLSIASSRLIPTPLRYHLLTVLLSRQPYGQPSASSATPTPTTCST